MKKSIDELAADKILEMVNYLLSKRIKPDITIDNVTELSEEEIERIKEMYDIEGVILDVDNTLRTNMQGIPKVNQEWLDMIKQKLKVIVVSNGVDGKVEKFFRLKGIEYIGFAHKPLKKSFLKACEKMKINPEKVLVIGDEIISDIYGGKRNKMKTILVKNEKGER